MTTLLCYNCEVTSVADEEARLSYEATEGEIIHQGDSDTFHQFIDAEWHSPPYGCRKYLQTETGYVINTYRLV